MSRRQLSVATPTRAAPTRGNAAPLRINTPGDRYEREAETAAEQVVGKSNSRMSWSLSSVALGAPLQRECACGGTCQDCQQKQLLQRDANGSSAAQVAPPIVHNVLRGPGAELPGATRSFMESRFGHDFGGVRVYHNDGAAASARAVSANAYTVGEKIVFNQGKYSPDSSGGRRLLAHELAHVVQQSRGGGTPPAGGSSALESEAGDISRRVDSPGASLAVQQSSGVGMARDAAPGQQTLIEVKFPDGVKQLTPEEFAEYKRRALHNLRVDLKLVAGLADNGRQTQESLLNEYHGNVESITDVFSHPKALIGIAADMKAGVTPPYIGAWSHPKHAVELGLAACDRGDLAEAARLLNMADADYRSALHEWNVYREATIGGAEGVVSNLETVRDVSFAIALVAGAAVAAPLIAGAVGAAGATGATATVLTTAGTGLVTAAGGATLRGGSAAAGSYAATGKVDLKEVKREALKGGKEGLVTGLTAGLGASLSGAKVAAKLSQPFVQAAAKRCLSEAGVNLATEVTTEMLDKALPTSEAKKNEDEEETPKPLVPAPARAALTGCLSGVLGVPVAKLGQTGRKVTEAATTAGVSFVDAKLSGQSNKQAALAAGQAVLTSAAVAHGHAGSEHAKAAKAAQGSSAQGTPAHAAPTQVTQAHATGVSEPAATHSQPETHATPEPHQAGDKQAAVEKVKATLAKEGAPAVAKEDAVAKEPVGGGHEVVVTPQGIGRCSPSPCPVIHLEYAKELKANPHLQERYQEIQQLRKSNPKAAAEQASHLVDLLETSRHAAAKGPESFADLGAEMGLDPEQQHSGGVPEAIRDSVAGGLVNPDGSPRNVDAVFQAYGQGYAARKEFGLVGKGYSAAHMAPGAMMKGQPKYNYREALSMNLPRDQHYDHVDKPWKSWSRKQPKGSRPTVAQARELMHQGIDSAPKISERAKAMMKMQLDKELFSDHGLKLNSKLRLPWSK